MLLEKVIVGDVGVNCYILADEVGGSAFVIDPGSEYAKIRQILDRYSIKVKTVLNTHGHYDHIMANDYFGAPIYIHHKDRDFLIDSRLNLSFWSGLDYKGSPADRLLEEGEELPLGEDLCLKVLHTPGHTPGSICLVAGEIIFSGDTLFCNGVGRTDFAYADEDDLFSSIRDKLFRYPDNFLVYPGHGPETSIGDEKRNISPNP